MSAAEDPAALLAPPPGFTTVRARRHRPAGKRSYLRLILGGAGLVLLLALLVLGGWWLRRNWVSWGSGWGEVSSGPGHESKLYNYYFRYPGGPWTPDERTRLDLRTAVALRRTNPNAWVVILTRDYKERMPQDADLIDVAVRRLEDYFKEHFEWQVGTPGELAGKRALRLEFVAEANSVPVSGECYMLADSGIAYWFLTWEPTDYKDSLADDWGRVRQGFSLLNERQGWKPEKLAKQATLPGTKGEYRLTYTEGLWEQQDRTAYNDDAVDLALLGHDQTDPRDEPRMGALTAEARVLVLPQAADLTEAVKEARAHVEAQLKKVSPDTTLKDVPLSGKGDQAPTQEIGDTQGRIVRLSVENSDGPQRYLLLAVVQQGNQVLAVQCECDARRRTYWDANFTQLLRGFHKGK